MIKIAEWNAIYRHMFDFALSQLEPGALSAHNESADDWLAAFRVFNDLQDALFINSAVPYKTGPRRGSVKGLELTAKQLSDLFHAYMDDAGCHVARYFLFSWWNHLRDFVPDATLVLDDPSGSFKPATAEEIAYARANFGHVKELWNGKEIEHSHEFPDDSRVLQYRGCRFIVDCDWGDAWTKDKNGAIRHFQLNWDWWYPIDLYLDIESA